MITCRSFKAALLLAFIIINTHSSFAQRFDSLLNLLDSKYPQEKVYLHLDKSYYNPGETIWFKAYLTSANLPSSISKTLYAELIDEKGRMLQKKSMPVIESGAASYFDLPDTLLSSQLYVRAYTSWMLNFDSTLLYLKPVHIISTNIPTKKTTVPVTPNLYLFPEGGDLVTGINSRIAFKAVNPDGSPFDITGNVVDEQGKKMASFASIHDGMGYFFFTPIAEKKYKAVWKDKKGLPHETLLPEVKKQGVVIHIENTSDRIVYILTRPDSVDESFTSFYLVAQMQQQFLYSAQINMSKKTTISAAIPTDSLGDGIMQLTVFNADKIPVAERIVFINHHNYYFITDLHAVEKNLDKRGHNTLQVDVGGSLLSNLSISVTDESINPIAGKEENIFSQLLLTSDLKGSVYNPAYYFSSEEDSVKQHLDLVMMTNGWRRFKWEYILAGKFPKTDRQPENYLTVKGKIFGLSKSLLTGKELNLILKAKSGAPSFVTVPITKEGDFKFDGAYFFDTAFIYYQLNNDKDKLLTSTASFSFDNGFMKMPSQPVPLPASLYFPTTDTSTARKNRMLNNLLRQQFFEGNKIKSLGVVTIKSRQKSVEEKMNEEYTSGLFSGGDAMVFSADDDPFIKSSYDVLGYLRGKVAGLQISPDDAVTWRGSETSLFLDETNADISMIKAIPMSNIAMIKVFRPPFFGAFGGGSGGAIAIYTRKGNDKNALVKGLDHATLYGYSSLKEFYSPDYEKNTDPTLNDYRSTLYWNPFVLFDKTKRRVKIPFYNSDNCKKIRVVIEGLNEAGQLTREEKVFE